LPWFEVAGGIVFEIWLVTAQSILADMSLAGPEVWNNNASVVATFASDDLATSERINPSESSTIG
jgi:hypothetical protein